MSYQVTKQSSSSVIRSVFSFIVIFLAASSLILPQNKELKKGSVPSPTSHHEVKDDDYVPVSRSEQGRSPAYRYVNTNIFTTQVNVDENGQNIVGDAANEPSIAVNPLDHSKMAIGWRQFNSVSNNFRQAGYGYTTNGGQSWTFPGVIEPGIFRSDPVLDYDTEGNFYYNSLTNSPTYMCKVFKSSTGGSSWNSGSDAQGGDKQWMTIDKTNGPGNGHIYAFWTSFYSVCYPGFFTRSTDAGASFENCTVIPDDPSWGTLMVASNGNLYVGAASSDFVVARSSNAQISGQTPSWDMATTVNLNGFITYGIGPNPDGLGGQTSLAVDTSGGSTQGNVYLLCSVEPYSGPDPLDVMFARSTNGGVNWSAPVRINDDASTSAYQWFGTMSVAPTGRIDVVWLDTRDHPGTYTSALYYSNSTDGGLTWSPNERLSDFFDPHLGWPNQQKMGDYFHMVSDSNGARLAWAATFNQEEDVYYSYISDSTTVPVELVSFSSSVSGNFVVLNWSTATELNNRGFEIQRSKNGTDWSTIGFKEGKGTTTEPSHYSYSDELTDRTSTTLYYRLKQVDYNGSFNYSQILSVDLAPSVYMLAQNYPNPFNPTTAISYQLPVNGFVTLKVYDVLGNEIATLVNEQKTAGTYKVTWNASDNPSGVYFYQLNAGSYTNTKKMILLR